MRAFATLAVYARLLSVVLSRQKCIFDLLQFVCASAIMAALRAFVELPSRGVPRYKAALIPSPLDMIAAFDSDAAELYVTKFLTGFVVPTPTFPIAPTKRAVDPVVVWALNTLPVPNCLTVSAFAEAALP
jgi:hypothetical protein